MTFQQLQTAVYRKVKLPDSPPAADATRIQQFLNLCYRELLAKPGMERCRDLTLTFATVASQLYYGLPQAIAKERSIFDTTNQRRIWPRTLDWVRSVDPGLSATSATTEFWIPFPGWVAQLVQPATTGVGLWAVSSAAGDTTQKVYLETTRLGGVRAGTAVAAGTTLTGTTRVAIGSITDHIEVVKLYLDTATTGTISLYDAASSGNVISQITPGRTQARYFMIQLYPTPSAAVTLSVDAQRSLEDLVNPTEEPLFPEDYHHALVHLATAEEWATRSDARETQERLRGNAIVKDLLHSLLTNPDEIPVQRGPRGTSERVSRLGSYYPAGT